MLCSKKAKDIAITNMKHCFLPLVWIEVRGREWRGTEGKGKERDGGEIFTVGSSDYANMIIRHAKLL